VNLSEARREYAAKFKPNPWIYWTDFLASAGLSWAALALAVLSEPLSLPHIVATMVGIFAMLRAVLFIHELAHLKRRALPFFEIAYNLFFGIPFLAPSLLYTGSHGDHHRQNLVGTAGDPEYAGIARWNTLHVLFFVVSIVAAPALLVLRFGLLGPISFVVPPLRRLIVGRASALVINNAYDRPSPKGKDLRSFVVQELAAAVWIWSLVALFANDILSPMWAMQWFAVAAGTLLVNQIRTLAAHRYVNDGHKLTVEEQLLDSINLDGGSFLTALAAPVGLRFHALHHFLPNVPYHALPALHQALLKELPSNSAYRESSQSSIMSAVYKLLLGKPLDDLKGVYRPVKAHSHVESDKD
jgi:fatty acid desaturase